jgi:predicted permease
VIPLIAVIGAAALAGYGAEHRFRSGAEQLARRLMWTVLWVLMPIIAFFNIASLHVDAHVGAGIGFAWVAVCVTLAIAYLVGTRVLHLPRPSVGALMTVSVFGNTAFLGLPFTVALFGFDELGAAVALLVPPLIVLGLSRLVIDVPDVYLSQAAMASAINNLVVAHEFELDRGLVAAAIAWSTAVVVPVGALVALL